MQAERATMRAPGTVWNGAVVKSLSSPQSPHQPNAGNFGPAVHQLPASPRPGVAVDFAPVPSHNPVSPPENGQTDPDFPRRVPSTRVAPTLYDPAAPPPIPAAPTSRPDSAAPSISPEDAIEARLAALSVTSGISIGPAPAKSPPSYAKIVRRE